MSKTLHITPLARADLEEIWLYGMQAHGIEQADNYITALNECFNLLVNNPYLYPEYAEFTPAVRIAPIQQHLIIYLEDESVLTIVRLLHRKQNVSGQI